MRALYPTGINSEFGVVANKPVITVKLSTTTTTTTITGVVTTGAGGEIIITTSTGTVIIIDTNNVVTIDGTVITGATVTGSVGTGLITITIPGDTTVTVTVTGGGTVTVDTTGTITTETVVPVVTPDANLPVTVVKFKVPADCSVELPGLGLPTFSCHVTTGVLVTDLLNIVYNGKGYEQIVQYFGQLYDFSVPDPIPTQRPNGDGITFVLGVEQVSVNFDFIKATGETVITIVGVSFVSKNFESSTGKTTVVMHTVAGHVVRAIGVLSSVTTTGNEVVTTGDTTPVVIGLVNDTKLTETELAEALLSLGISFEPKSVLLTNKNTITDTIITIGEPTDPVITPTDPPTPVPPVAVNEVKAPWTMYFPVQVGGFVFALNSYDTGTETTGAMQLVKFDATTFAFISQVRISKRRIHWLSAHDGYIYSIGVSDLATNPTSNIQSFCKFDTDLNLVESIDLSYTAIPPFKWAQTTEGIWTGNRNIGLSNITYNIGSHSASEIATPNIYSWVITDGTSLWYWGSSTVVRFDISANNTVNMNLTLVDGVVVGEYIYGITPLDVGVIPKLERWHKYSGARDGLFGYEMKNESFSNGYHQVHTDGRYIVFGAADIQVYDTVSNSIVYSRPRNTYHMSMAAHFMAPGKLVIAVTDISYDQRNVIARYSLVVTL